MKKKRPWMEEMSDEELLVAYFAGESQGFVEFYKRHLPRVRAYALRKGLGSESAEELCQEVFLRLHRAIHRYERGRPALPWFFTIVHHAVLDMLSQARSEGKLRFQLEGQNRSRGATEPSISEEALIAQETLKDLSAEQKLILQLRFAKGQGFKEISTQLGKTEVALRKSLSRARGLLIKALVKGDSL